MNLIDRIIMMLLCSSYLFIDSIDNTQVIVFLVAISISLLNFYYDNTKIRLAFAILYLILCNFYPTYLTFLPLVLYDLILLNKWWYAATSTVFELILLFLYDVPMYYFIFPLTLVSYLLAHRTKTISELHGRFKKMRDDSTELNILLHQKNQDLLEKQEYEIHLATLKERNRIAREIHDNVGHLLSRSILQVAAMNAIHNAINGEQNKELSDLNQTLNQAMTSIRQSVHDLHDESVKLCDSVQRIIREFPHLQIEYQSDTNEITNRSIQYCFIMIIKEALSNVIKHSNATKVQINLSTYNTFYLLIIEDNGTEKKPNSDNSGIGLYSMEQRVDALHGSIRINKKQGYKIFVNIPKEPAL